MSNKRFEPKTVKNYIGKTRSGLLDRSVGHSIRDGWTNPKNSKNLKKAGFQTASEILNNNQ